MGYKTVVYILHYSDAETHPMLKVSNLALNELLMRCMHSIRDFGKESKPHVVVVDNGSPPEGHDDAVTLLKENGFEPEWNWVRKDWHPVPTGANAALTHFLDSPYELMHFITSDMKITPGYLKCTDEILSGNQMDTCFAEPNITFYAIGDPKKYRTPSFWQAVNNGKIGYNNQQAEHYFLTNGVEITKDSWGETMPISSRTELGVPGRRISIFAAKKKAVEMAGLYDEEYLRASEFQYYYQAVKRGVQCITMGYVYLSHMGGIFRVGVGAYNTKQYNKYGPKGDFRFKGGRGNVFQ